MGDEFLWSLVGIEYLMLGYVSCLSFLYVPFALCLFFCAANTDEFILGNPA